MKTPFCIIISFLIVFPVFSEVSFSDPDVNPGNEVLFSVSAEIPGAGSYQTLFNKSLNVGSIEQLTFFPECLESLQSGRIIQIRNRFGTVRYDIASGFSTWVEERKPFIAGGSILAGVLPAVSTSPDGHWQVFIEPVTAARGKMILFDTFKEVRYILADSVERGSVPVSWAPDSSVFIYEVAGTLHFARPESFFSVTVVADKYRVLGPGHVNCISWYTASRFMYVVGTDVYRIQASELFARSLYSSLLGYGELAGKIPFPFDPACDAFSVSPDSTSILYARGKRSVYYCPLEGDDYVAVTKPALLPWVLLSGNTVSTELFWSPTRTPIVLAYSMEDGRRMLKAWKVIEVSGSKVFSPVRVPERVVTTQVSRNGASIAFITPTSVRIYDTSLWEELGVYRDQKVVSAVWGDGAQLFVGGAETLTLWNYQTGLVKPLLVSAVRSYGWDEAGTTILAEITETKRIEYTSGMRWVPSATVRIRPAMGSNASWRLYVDSGKGFYSNMLYVRSAGTPGGTWPLVREPNIPNETRIKNLSRAQATIPASIFSHGKRTGNREVSLVFDAMDTLEGLSEILHTLKRYGIRSTFFINGEFIRRNPAAVNEIVKAGHQCASLFYTTWDLSGNQFRIDEDFIIRGLSRNEDDFFNATGQELSLLWHAPYFVTSPEILSAGEKAGYRYITPDILVPDWLSVEQEGKMPGLYKNAVQLVEDIVREKQPGSIIPIRIGKPDGKRDSFLFEKVDLLINALIESGYELVSLDTLIQNASR